MVETCPDLSITFWSVLGGVMTSFDERPFAISSKVGLDLTYSEYSRIDLLPVSGAHPLRYQPGDPSIRTFVLVPESMIDDPARLSAEVDRGIGALGSTVPRRSRQRVAQFSLKVPVSRP